MAAGSARADDGLLVVTPFSLTATTGETIESAALDGRPYALFFGFTHCPDVCPTTFSELGLALQAVGDAARDLRVLFVSVDPDRDDPATMKSYLSAFDPRIVGLSGDADQIAALKDALHVTARRVPLDGGDYTMEHTATVFLVDANGLVTDRIAYTDGVDVMAKKIKGLIEGP